MRGKRRASRREVRSSEGQIHHTRIIALRKAWNQVRKGLLYGSFAMAMILIAAACMTEDLKVCAVLSIPSLIYAVTFILVNYKTDKIFR